MAPNYTLKFVFPLFQDDEERKGNPKYIFLNVMTFTFQLLVYQTI